MSTPTIIEVEERVHEAIIADSVLVSAGGSGGGRSSLTGDIELLVAADGEDESETRPAAETDGDLTEWPFATIGAARSYLPDNLGGFTATIVSTADAAEEVRIGGVINGTLVLDGVTLSDSIFRSCNLLRITNATVVGEVVLNDCRSEVDATCEDGGCVLIQDGRNEVDLVTDGNSETVLRAEHARYLGYAVAANECTATPVELFNVHFSELIGDGLTGDNPDAPAAVSISGAGKHVLTGALMTAATELDLDGYAVTWSALSSKNYQRAGTYAFWGDNRWVNLGQFEHINDSSQDYDDNQFRDLQVGRFFKGYGFLRFLAGGATGDAYNGAISAHAAGGQASATLCATQKTIITSAAPSGAANASVRLMSEDDSPGFGSGVGGEVWNNTAYPVDLYPPTGKKLHLGGVDQTANVAVVLEPGSKTDWLCDNNANFVVG